MARSKCSKDLYKSFLQASSVRYTGKALSEVSPIALSHDSASRWLNSQNFRPEAVVMDTWYSSLLFMSSQANTARQI